MFQRDLKLINPSLISRFPKLSSLAILLILLSTAINDLPPTMQLAKGETWWTSPLLPLSFPRCPDDPTSLVSADSIYLLQNYYYYYLPSSLYHLSPGLYHNFLSTHNNFPFPIYYSYSSPSKFSKTWLNHAPQLLTILMTQYVCRRSSTLLHMVYKVNNLAPLQLSVLFHYFFTLYSTF